jgi:hypothetical protein
MLGAIRATGPTLTLAVSDTEVSSSTDVVVLRPVMWMFIAILVTFLGTRLITRRIRRQQRAAESAAARADGGAGDGSGGLLRNVSFGGVHIHHQVFGILIMCSVGIALIALSPQGTALNVCAALFGVGVSLAFDEFALWLHLDDVYWSPAGRQSVDAIFCLLIIVGILVGGVDFLTGAVGSADWWTSVVGLLITLGISVIALLKGKTMTGIIGVFFQLAAIIGAIRLAKPESWWARRRYRPGSKKALKSARRFDADYQRRWNRLRDLVAGAPDPGPAELGADRPGPADPRAAGPAAVDPLPADPLPGDPMVGDPLSVQPPRLGP